MKKLFILSCAVLCLLALSSAGIAVPAIPQLTATTATQSMASVTFVNDVGWEAVYAYTWTTTDGTTTEYSGSWPGSPLEAGADGTYVYECDEANVPAYIIFNNGSGGEGNQTADLVFQAGATYSFNGIHEFSNGKYLLRNVGADRYFGASNDWGTHASLLLHPEYVQLVTAPNGKYFIETQYSNGDGQIYFSGDYMDSSDKATLTITKTDRILHTIGGQPVYAYTIANGDTNYGYDGSSTILGKLSDGTDDNALWEIVSVEDAKAALAQATADAPKDATFLIADANFGRNNRYYDQWTFEASNQNNSGDLTNFCVESWHATFTMSQTLTGLPTGVYALEAQGFYRQDGSDEDHLPVFYINDATRTFPVRTGNENGMEDASASFTNGLYAIDPIFVTVSDGTITLGARLEENTALWCIWDNFTLMYYGQDANAAQLAFDFRFNGIVEEANGLLQTAGVTIEGQWLLNEALAAYQQLSANSSEDDQQTVEDLLNEAIGYAKRGLKLVDELSEAYDFYSPRLSATAGDDNSIMSLLTNIGTALTSQVFESNTQIEGWLADLQTARQQYYPYEYRYWFDFDETTAKSDISANPSWQMEVDLSGLSESFHSFHFQVSDKDNAVSSPVTRHFVKVADLNATSGRIWFDNDPSTMTTTEVTNDAIMFDVSALTDGYHILHFLAEGGSGTVSSSVTRPFIKIPQVLGLSHLTCLCIIDDQIFKQEEVPVNGGIMDWNLDVSSLPQGFHRMFVQVFSPSGAATAAYQAFFMRETTKAEFAELKCVYTIDGSEFYTEAGTLDKGTFFFNLDVAALEDGLHRLSYMLSNGKGVSTKAQTQFFMKTPLGGNGIIEYWYWLNDDDTNVSKVRLPERQDPFSLITLLPVEEQPIRSKLFEFRVENGNPIVYAKNDIHVRFYDIAGRSNDVSKAFVDERVSQEVTDAELLEPGTTTFAKPAENTIKWYKIEALRGDSLALRAQQACTLQLFSPSGKELYSASSPEVFNFDGSYASEDGTYYVALHDAMSQYDNEITVEFQHIDKYAVLSYTPKEIGITESYIYMKLEGNGFDKLESASLVNGDIIMNAKNITSKSKYAAELQFMFLGNEAEGTYDIVLDFVDEEETNTLTISDAVRFANPNFGDMAITVVPTRRAGFPYKVKVNVTNTGNVSKLYVPFNIGASFNLTGQMPKNDLSSCSWSEMYTMNFDVLYDPEEEGGYSPYTITDNLIDTGLPGVVLHGFIPEIGPGETKEYILGFVGGAHDKFNLYAWTGKSINETREVSTSETSIGSVWDYIAELDDVNNSDSRRDARKAPNLDGVNAALNLVDRINDRVGRIARNVVGIGLALGGIELGLRLRGIQGTYDAFGSYATEVLGDYEADTRKAMPTPQQIAEVLDLPGWVQWLLGLQDNQSSCGAQPVNPSPVDIYAPGDPNDIYGYMAESGSKFMREGTTDVYYTIEFENDPEIANASAHTIVVKDTLDTKRFDLSTFAAKSVKIGDKVMELNGEKNFSKRTMDLRPEIDVVAQVSLSLDEQKGIAKWTIESLDPMSMNPTEDVMQGVLPVNTNGNGQGEVLFDIKLKPGMVEGESVNNRAGIVFDQEGVIMTPTWTNTVDATLPVSHVSEVAMATDTTASVRIEAFDELSKPWKYDLYVQEGADGLWQRKAANVSADSAAIVPVALGIDYGFYVILTDSAGNVEQKEAAREFSFEVFAPQMDTNTKIELAQGWNWISHNQQEVLAVEALKPKAQRIVSQTDELFKDSRFGWTGDLDELLPTEMYKVQMAEADEVQLSGKLFNAAFRSVPLYEGWNWMGYPAANTMSPAEALTKLEAEEGDFIVGQDGMATFTEGQWTGTLTEMQPGQGYMYRSVSDKNLFLNATAQSSSRRANVQRSMANGQYPDGWTVDKRKYPNVMGLVADLMQDGEVQDANEWLVAAFCGAECRGLSQVVGGHLMMNVYGNGGEPIIFMALNCESGEVVAVEESEPFRTDILGTMQQPYELHSGVATGIYDSQFTDLRFNGSTAYDLQGRRINGKSSMVNGQLNRGVYIVTDEKSSTIQKVVKK